MMVQNNIKVRLVYHLRANASHEPCPTLVIISLKNSKHEGEQLINSFDPYNQQCPSIFIIQVGTVYTNYWSVAAKSFD